MGYVFFLYANMCYWYCSSINGPFGSPWIANEELEKLRVENISYSNY